MNSSINVTVERLGTWPTVPVCQMALAFVGLWLNIVSFAALILMHTSTKNTFYLMIISLSIVDMLYLTETLFYSLPCALARRIFLGAIFDRVVGHVDTITWFGQCSHVCFIAFNRFRFTCNTSLEKFDDVFSKTKTLMWLLGLWLFSLGMTLLSEAGNCVKSFDLCGFYWSFVCPKPASFRSVSAMTINSVVSGVLPSMAGVFYLVMWVMIRYRRAAFSQALGASNQAKKKRLRQELSMITQFAIITALLIANYLSFWVLPNLLSADAATVVIQMIAIFNASVNPCIYLAFNQALSRRMIALAACRGIEAARNATVAPTSNVDTKTRATTRDSQL